MTSSPKATLTVQDLGVTFSDASGVLHALHDLSFTLFENEFVTLIGPSGSGKSTLLRVLAGLIPPTKGTAQYNTDQPKVGLVFQKANLMPWRRVIDNIGLPLELAGVPKATIHDRAMDLIKLVGLEGFEQTYPQDLSGGMAQRVAIARSLMQDPDILLLDEPFGSLDALTRERMGDELLHIWQARQKTVLMVTHSISEAVYLSDRVLVLSPRPGTIKLDLNITLPRPRTPDMQYTSEFSVLAQRLRQSLREENGVV
ncbi:MAG: ABC transporter ATP-binding protein [Anaerolineaceae bacterium]|jgi:NitT/TauT family transport system ATP-binding protein|nr:ABC transporter ATP-binding protein [Anaerolineaceae bacterium]